MSSLNEEEKKSFRRAKARALKLIRLLEKRVEAENDPKTETRFNNRMDQLRHIEALLKSLSDRSKAYRPRKKEREA